MSKNDGRHETLEEDLERCISQGKRTCSSEMLGGQGADFLRGGDGKTDGRTDRQTDRWIDRWMDR